MATDKNYAVGDNIRVELRGESPWAQITEILQAPGMVKARIFSKVVAEAAHGYSTDQVVVFKLVEMHGAHGAMIWRPWAEVQREHNAKMQEQAQERVKAPLATETGPPDSPWTRALHDIQMLTYERTRAHDALAEVQRVLKVHGRGDALSGKKVQEILNRIGPVLDDLNHRQHMRDNPPVVMYGGPVGGSMADAHAGVHLPDGRHLRVEHPDGGMCTTLSEGDVRKAVGNPDGAGG